MRSYYRFTNTATYIDGGDNAGLTAMLYVLSQDYDEAYKWFVKAEQAYLEAIKATKEPEPYNKITGTSTVVTVLAAFAGGPIGFLVCASAMAVTAVEVNRYENSEEYITLRRQYHLFIANAQENIAFMQTEAKSVLQLKARIESETNPELPEA
jgi:hypothetical protein